jgi:SAM-dependent methyltransferase
VDIAVSFETLEHLPSPPVFLSELHRVLKPGGTLIVSTPNIEVYGVGNPFHCSEVTEEEFVSLLAAAGFVRPSFYSQSPRSAAWWSLRSLATFEPPWIHIKGAWRLREYLTRLASPRLLKQNTDAFRRRPVDAVLSGDRPWVRFLNPYLVRRRTLAFGETPTYFVAVAERAAAG